MQTQTQRMKTRYGAKVQTFQLETGNSVLYYRPRRSTQVRRRYSGY